MGTELITSRDAPALGGVYKLVAINDGHQQRSVCKYSQEKATLPGAKQVYRMAGPDGRLAGDMLALANEAGVGEALLEPAIRAGTRAAPGAPLLELQERARAGREALPDGVRRLRDPDTYPVVLSPDLAALSELLAQPRG